MTVRLTIELDDGRELATITTDQVPRLHEVIQTVDGLCQVTAVIWELTDAPLSDARVICSQPG